MIVSIYDYRSDILSQEINSIKNSIRIIILDAGNYQGDPSQANELPEFSSAGDFDDLNGTPGLTYMDGDILQTHSNFDTVILQTLQTHADFDGLPELASVEIDVQHFHNGIELLESPNADGHQSEIFPENMHESYNFVDNFHKTNIPQAQIKQSVCKASQVIQQLSCLGFILSENKNLQSQISSSLRAGLSDFCKTLDLYSVQFKQLLSKLLIEPKI
ncbi:37306_t:CDS:2 [Gigaspora margarita]|uniref:37306_t:CDS:1 n=1 Tax=Gigaspora margarita TaxID=4874 RepID=A0ABN7URX1_GIGMA|nr:37306_t:CDS:2 [Gigaspora margarita]